jgi:SAM-dependent methyltransferase
MGFIHGIDSSKQMISSAESGNTRRNCIFTVIDATTTNWDAGFERQKFDKVFSNAALHWILRDHAKRENVFSCIWRLLKPGGTFVFEMGGYGNVSECHAALLAAVSWRIGIEKAREADPWFFPDELWMKQNLESVGFEVEKLELELRDTKCEEGEGGGLEGWVRLMGKQFFDAVGPDGSSDREDCIKEVVQTLETVCEKPSGGKFLGYKRLRAVARKPAVDTD